MEKDLRMVECFGIMGLYWDKKNVLVLVVSFLVVIGLL